MTEPTPCINGCVRRPKDGSQPEPKLASRGRLCGGCYTRLEDWLKDIPVDFALLPIVLAGGGSQRMDGTSRTKQPEAPAPLRLDIAALADGRRRADPRIALPDVDNPAHLSQLGRAHLSGIREPGDELWYELEDIARVLTVLHTWAEDLRCVLDPTRTLQELNDSHSVIGESRYLLRAVDRLAEQPWVDDAMGELRLVWYALSRSLGNVVGKSLGNCFGVDCDGRVYRDRWTGWPECNVCHRDYSNPSDALKLRLTEEQAARLVHTSEAS